MESLHPYTLTDFNLYPHGVLNTPFGNKAEITHLHIADGVAEVLDQQDLTSSELRAGVLAATGMSNLQISELFTEIQGTRASFGRDTMSSLMTRIGADNRHHMISRLFERRILRVAKPAVLTDISTDDIALLSQAARGMTFDEIGASANRTGRSAQSWANKLNTKLGSNSMARSVLLGHIGEILPHGSSQCSLAVVAETRTTISRADRQGGGVPEKTRLNYISGPNGIFTIHRSTTLTHGEQSTLAYAAADIANPDIARIERKSAATIANYLGAIYAKLQATNRPHAITQGLAKHALEIISHNANERLTQKERFALSLSALGYRSYQSGTILKSDESTVRDLHMQIIQKLGAKSLAGAVMTAYLNREIELADVLELGSEIGPIPIDTSGA